MMEKLQRLMLGRAGLDALSVALALAFLAVATIGQGFNNLLIRWISLIPLGICLFRVFSRQVDKRRRENDWFLSLGDRIRGGWQRANGRFHDAGVYRFFVCAQCGQKMRVPKGRGKVEITCPRCGNKVVKKT